MCGRYTITTPGQIPLRFDAAPAGPGEMAPRYNVAPSQPVPVVLAEAGGRAVRLMRWGFAPPWREQGKGPAPINARAETLLERPLFRGAVARHRCLIPADGFYEWQARPGTRARQPYYIRLRDGGLFAFAGLYTPGDGPDDARPATCAIITTAPNALVSPIHDRMPAILTADAEAAWLDPDLAEPRLVVDYLQPYAAGRMEAYAVPALVSSVRNEGPSLIQPLV